jgi:ABC-type sugar transport system substrate-binding protein
MIITAFSYHAKLFFIKKIEGVCMSKKKVLNFLILSALFICVAGAMFASGAEETAAEKNQLTIGRILIFEVDDYQQTAARHAKDYCAENGIELILTSSDADVEKERAIVEDMIVRQVDAIIIQCITASDATEMKKLAGKAGIPIVFFFQNPSEEPYVHVTADERDTNVALGASSAKLWKEKHPDKPVVVGALMKKENEFAMNVRIAPFIEGVRSVEPDARVVEIPMTNEASLDLIQSNFEDAIVANPEINVVCAFNASQTLTAYNVLKSFGRGTTETEVIGGIQGSLDEYLRMLEPDSSYAFSVGMKPYDYEVSLFETALKMINGEIAIDGNERVVEGSILLGKDSDWKEYIEKQWSKDFDEEMAKVNAE